MAEIKSNLVDLEVVYNKLNATIDKNINLLKEGATAVDAYNKKISVVPSAYKSGLDSLANSLEKVKQSEIELTKAEKEKANAIVKLNQVQRSQNQTEISNLRTKTQLIALEEKHEKQLAREQAKLQASENLYVKVQTKLNSLSNEYKDLATRKEMGLSLTAKEEQRYLSLQNRIQTYDKTLKAVDATMGKHQRNVGNYASAFNPLSNSINQLTREMPAFTYSVQTGFMALSNNIPIFTDAIQNAVKQNKELIDKGQPTTSILKQVAGALFSFQTLLGVGITLLTVYGKEIGNWIKELNGASQALDELNENQKAFYNSKKEGKKESITERTELEKYVRVMRNSNLTMEDRMIALDKIRKQFPYYLKNLTDEQLLNGNIRKELSELNLALERRAVLEKATESNVKNKQKLVDLQAEKEALKDSIPFLEKQVQVNRELAQLNPREMSGMLTQSENKLNDAKKRRVQIDKEILEFNKAILQNNKTINILKSQTIGLEDSETDAKEKNTKATKKNTEEKEKNAKGQLYSKEWFDRMIGGLEAEQRLVASMSPAYDILGRQIRLLKIAYEELYGTKKKVNEETEKEFEFNDEKLRKAFENIGKDAKKSAEDFLKMLADYKQGFIDTFADQSGFSGLLGIISGDLEKFQGDAVSTALAVSEAFQQAFNTISEASQANFDAEYERLEKQRDFAIEMAGGSATAREEIDRQYDERKRAIQKREAEAQKRLAIFNIVTNTAQAILATYAKVGFPAGIPLAIAMGAIGAFQVGMVASQEIPQFWKGTENAPEGLAWTQEKGAEVITDKRGNIKTLGSDKGAQLTYLSKGDKVYKSHEDYINKVLSKNGISDLGSYINFTPQKEVNNSFDMAEMKQEFSKLASVIKNKDGVNISIDEKGFRKKQGNTEFINSRLNLKSRQV